MEFTPPTVDFGVILPVVWIALWALVLMFIDLWVANDRKEITGWLSLVGLIPALIIVFIQWGTDGASFAVGDGPAMIVRDNYAAFLNILYLVAGILAILFAVDYVKRSGTSRGEFYFLLLFSICGMMLMGMSNDLIMVFLALELLSIPLYILSGFDTRRDDSEESAMKYFLLGAFSSGFLVFGIALIYGATGSTALPEVFAGIANGGALGLAGVGLLLVGFAFKVGAVPFHMWTPDVYEGAPTAVTAFMSVGAKVGGFAAMMRVFVDGFGALGDTWVAPVAVIAALTMIVGNVAAISQQNIKRMLAYSSIAHAGYILIAVAAIPLAGGTTVEGNDGVSAALFYMLAYLFTNLGAFAVVMAVERHEGKQGLLLEDYKGLAARKPALSFAFAFLMLSLTGIPTTGGFTAKFYVFRAGVGADLIWLVVIGALTSVVSAFYYLRPVYFAYMYDGPATARVTRGIWAVVGVAVVVTLILGLLPGPWYSVVQEAGLSAVGAVAGGG